MNKSNRNIWWLIVGISGLSVLGWFINTFTPDSMQMVALFFLIITVTAFFSSLFVFKIMRRAILVTLGILIWLLLRLMGLRDWYYPILLIPILISLEILLEKR